MLRCYRFNAKFVPPQDNLLDTSCLLIIKETNYSLPDIGRFYSEKLLKNKCETKTLGILCSNVVGTVLTSYFVPYYATIRAENMHLFAYSAAIF